jgi:hypothetical protein
MPDKYFIRIPKCFDNFDNPVLFGEKGIPVNILYIVANTRAQDLQVLFVRNYSGY